MPAARASKPNETLKANARTAIGAIARARRRGNARSRAMEPRPKPPDHRDARAEQPIRAPGALDHAG